jgi:uncharacterized protein YecA (UPF0149 family)
MSESRDKTIGLLGAAYLAAAGSILSYPDLSKSVKEEIRKTRNPKKDKRRWGYRVPEDPNKGVGRNDLCPCGSGLKFKKCCIKPWNK